MKTGTAPSDASTRETDFPEFERLLWRVLASLSKRGYFVPPDEGRDLIHEFYVEAWAGLLTRFDSRLGPFPIYVAGAFFRFARRRLVEMHAWQARLVDLELAAEHASGLPTPEEQLDSRQQLERVSEALQRLPGKQRQVLYTYLSQAAPSERSVAALHGLSRYTVRQTLAAAMSSLHVQLRESGFKADEVKLAELAWADGCRSAHIAGRLRMSLTVVEHKRHALAECLVTAARKEQETTHERDGTMNFPGLLKSYFAAPSGRGVLQSLNESERERLREELFNGNFELSPEEYMLLQEHPEKLGELYDELVPKLEERSDSDLDAALAFFQASEARDLAEAFELLLSTLPDKFMHWEEWGFSKPRLPEAYVQSTSRKVAADGGGERTQTLVRFGLTPAVFSEAFGGFSLLLDARRKHWDYSAPQEHGRTFAVLEGARPIRLTWEDAILCARRTPGLPEVEGADRALAAWISRALSLRPYLLPGYRCIGETEDTLVLAELPESHPAKVSDIHARWNRLDSNEGRQVFANKGFRAPGMDA